MFFLALHKFFKIELTLSEKFFNRNIWKRWNSKYYLTTPIFYVNAEPHIGHLYTSVIADAAVRFQKLKNPNLEIKFMVGTDEHGLKVSKSAETLKIDVNKFCDNISGKYKSLFDTFDIDSTDFVRTTEERHIKAATALWKKIASNGYIYKENYSGWYCVSDEMFVPEISLMPETKDGLRFTIEGKKPVEYISEENYKFKLNKFQNDLLHWMDSGKVVKPKKFYDLLRNWIVSGEVLADVSVSRPMKRVFWGIPVPEDSSQSIYVWLDALSSYLCSNGYPNSNFKWPPDIQIIGKDIIRFHGILWPAFLMAADLEPPKCILCHSHWLVNGEKMSKSKGNVIDPFKKAKEFTSEGLRFFLLKQGTLQNDANYVDQEVIVILNADLCNNLGNLLNRCTGTTINQYQIFPTYFEEDYYKFGTEESEILKKSLKELPGIVALHYEDFNFYRGIEAIFATLNLVNQYFNCEKPWLLCKQKDKIAHLNLVLNLTMESLRVCGILLQPIIPNLSNKILNKLSIEKSRRSLQDIHPFSWELNDKTSDSNLMAEKFLLFPKIAPRA